MERAVVMKSVDNVATCLTNLQAGAAEPITVDGARTTVQIKNDIPFGHKIALSNIGPGEQVIKYGEVIGVASREIAVGEHVHVHNVESVRARGDKA